MGRTCSMHFENEKFKGRDQLRDSDGVEILKQISNKIQLIQLA
jgi:hypothetical protein